MPVSSLNYFEIVNLDGSGDGPPVLSPDNLITRFYFGVVGDGGVWGEEMASYLCTPEVTAIYERHGLSPFDN